MSILNCSARPFAALVATTVALGLAAGPANAAAGKTTSTATVAKAKSKSKSKSKTKAKAKTKSKPKADLTVKGLFLDLADDGTLSVSANVFNQGKLFAKSSTVAIVLSEDTRLSDDDEVLDELDLQRVGGGVKRAISDDVDVPLDIDTSLDWNVLVCADSDGVITEKNETNNCASQEITLDDIAADDSAADDSSADDSGDDVSDDSGDDPTDSAGDDW